jgi:imidazolonepropionase-like amidohydrolase
VGGRVSAERTWAALGGSALAGRELQLIPRASVVVTKGTITAVGDAASVSVPPGTETLDLAGLTLLPGFIDTHVHIALAEPHSVVAGGVTCVRDLGWPPDAIFELVRASESPHFDGPTVVAAGAMLTAPRGYPTRAAWAPAGTGIEVKSPSHAGDIVGDMVQRGAAIIKIALNPPVGATFDQATLAAIVDAAHAAGLRVTGHIYGVHELEKALDAGVDELAHMLMGTEAIPQPTIERMVDQHVTVVPTMAIRRGEELYVAVENLRNFVAAGGRVVYGTDLGNEGPRSGIDPGELAHMAAAGMSPRSIIASGTTRAAEWLGLDDTGVLEPGRNADIIAVRGDPLSDSAVLSDPTMVFRKGRRVA